MTKIQRTLLFGIVITVLASISSLLIVMSGSTFSDKNEKILLIVWLSSLIPTIISGFISAFLYHYLCESPKRRVHVVWFILNLAFIVGFAPFIAFVVLNSMLN